MAEPDPGMASGGGPMRRFLTFRVDQRLYALPAEEVIEVIRTPAVARVPQGPAGLLGMANLRGSAAPVASLRGLLGRPQVETTAASRTLVLAGATTIALAVDGVDALVSVDPERVETVQARLGAETGEQLRGAFGGVGDEPVARILDIQALLASAFAQRARPVRAAAAIGTEASVEARDANHAKLVTFEVAGQEYAMNLEAVREIIPAPADLAFVPRSEALVLGVASYRDTLLPLFSLRGLLGFPADAQAAPKVLVVAIGGAVVGLVADRMRAILPADPDLIEPTPSILAARTGGETRIKAVYRGEGGRRLVSILAPEQLFRDDVMARLGHAGEAADLTAADQDRETLRFLVFRLGEDEFGLPIEVVDEVAQVPVQITRVPKTPKFLEGVINLRGEVVPVVDQRRRFDMPPLEDGARRRLVVVRTERHRAGLIVDSVSDVLSAQADAIEPAPDLTGETTRLVSGVINLERAGRMILVLDPTELLSRTERGLLDKFQASPKPAGS